MRIECESGEHVSGLVYSRRTPRNSSRSDSRDTSIAVHSDWTCPNCAFVNFAKRSECFRCTTPKHPRKTASNSYQQENDDGSSQVGSNPCNTVIIQGLDGLTTEQSLLDALAIVTSLEPKNCYVMRNFSTGVSLGYAFMEFDSAINGKKIRDHFTNKQPFEVDGKLVVVEYAKNTYSTILASIQYQSIDRQQHYDQYNQSQYRKPTEYELQALAASSANQMSKIQQKYEQDAYAAAAQASQSDAAANGYSHLPQYPEPDVSTYQYDAATGFYYDSSTGLYYDANSQYYYNMTTQEYMYWDGTAKTYIPVSNTSTSTTTTTTSSTTDYHKPSEVSKEKEEKKNKAKNIAKEMEKWAKSQNKKSKASAPIPTATAATDQSAGVTTISKPASADTAYDLLVGKKFASASNKSQDMMPPPPMMAGMKRAAPTSPSGLVASYGGDDSDGEEEHVNEVNHIDKQKLTCNLCERKFNSTAILEKHVDMSELHKQNLIKFQQKSQGQLTNQYRDRAKERRMKEGGGPRSAGFIRPSQYV